MAFEIYFWKIHVYLWALKNISYKYMFIAGTQNKVLKKFKFTSKKEEIPMFVSTDHRAYACF